MPTTRQPLERLIVPALFCKLPLARSRNVTFKVRTMPHCLAIELFRETTPKRVSVVMFFDVDCPKRFLRPPSFGEFDFLLRLMSVAYADLRKFAYEQGRFAAKQAIDEQIARLSMKKARKINEAETTRYLRSITEDNALFHETSSAVDGDVLDEIERETEAKEPGFFIKDAKKNEEIRSAGSSAFKATFDRTKNALVNMSWGVEFRSKLDILRSLGYVGQSSRHYQLIDQRLAYWSNAKFYIVERDQQLVVRRPIQVTKDGRKVKITVAKELMGLVAKGGLQIPVVLVKGSEPLANLMINVLYSHKVARRNMAGFWIRAHRRIIPQLGLPANRSHRLRQLFIKLVDVLTKLDHPISTWQPFEIEQDQKNRWILRTSADHKINANDRKSSEKRRGVHTGTNTDQKFVPVRLNSAEKVRTSVDKPSSKVRTSVDSEFVPVWTQDSYQCGHKRGLGHWK